jgi:hypothetical protein
MTDLSPAAEAVLNAVTLNRYDAPYYACPKSIGQIKSDVAAALRAAADQVVPARRKPMYADRWEESAWTAEQDTRAELLAIAAELERHS